MAPPGNQVIIDLAEIRLVKPENYVVQYLSQPRVFFIIKHQQYEWSDLFIQSFARRTDYHFQYCFLGDYYLQELEEVLQPLI